MAQIYHTSKTELIFPSGRSVNLETKYTDTTITEIKEKEITVAASSTAILWDKSAASENISTLTFSKIINNSANLIDVEYVIDDGSEVGEELYTVEIPPKGHHILMSGTSYANHLAGDAFGGTKDVIEKIRVKESSGVAANIVFILGGVS